MSEVWLVKARRTQRANRFMRWFYLTNIVLNLYLFYFGKGLWISRVAALVLLVALVANEALIHKLDQAIKEVNMITPVEPDPTEPVGPDDDPPDE